MLHILMIGVAFMATSGGIPTTAAARVTARSQMDNLECPFPFIRANSECFYIHQKPKLSWELAEGYCGSLGGKLAEPKSVELLQAALLEKPGVSECYFWIGASDQTQEMEWKWVSGRKTNLELAAWKDGEPNNYYGEDCLLLSRDEYPTLSDEDCEDEYSFICEYLNEHVTAS